MAQEIASSKHPRPRRSELPDGRTQCLSPALRRAVEAKEAALKQQPDVRPLSAKEMRQIRGAGPYRNAALCGNMPWHRSVCDVDLCTGNLFKSFTDVQVSPARGAGLVLQRTYNSDDDRIGPFGVGWTHAYDIRVEEAGNNNVARTDFFGGKHSYHRDADGLYSPPVYLYDELSSAYNRALVNGPADVAADTDVGMDGTTKHFSRNGNERVCDYIQDRHGNTTNLTYGMQVTIGGVTKGLLTQVTDPSGRSLQFTWSNLGTQDQPAWRITHVQGPEYGVAYEYNSELNLWKVHLDASGLNRTTTYGYTSCSGTAGTETGLLSSITDPMGATVSIQYSITGITNTVWPVAISVPAGVLPGTSTARYETWGFSPGTEWIRDSQPETINLVTYCGSLAFQYFTDTSLRVIDIEAGESFAGYTLEYDTNNNVTRHCVRAYSTVNPGYKSMSRDDRYTYGPHGNVLTHWVNGFSGTDTTTYYDSSQYFQKQSVTDALGRTTSFNVGTKSGPVGERGEILNVRDARYQNTGKQWTYAYNDYGQKVSETNLNDVVTQYSYGDQWGNLTEVRQDPTGLNRITSMTYDESGHVLSSTDPNGRTSTFTYNALGQPDTASFPATQNTPSETVSYTYGANGRMDTVGDNRGTTSIEYEANGDRVHSVTDPVTGMVSYTYTVRGDKRSVTLPNGDTTQFVYHEIDGSCELMPKDDPNSLRFILRAIVDKDGRRVDYETDYTGAMRAAKFNQTYDTNGNLVSYCETDYLYDNAAAGSSWSGRGWLTTISTTYHWLVNGQWQSRVLEQNDYTYNNAGMRLSNAISDVNGPVRTEQYGYDELNRLTAVNYGDGETQSYTFDNMGNRLTKVDNGTESYTYNNANMLLTRGGTAYTSDANGNTLTGGGRVNAWDSQNRLYSCTFGGATTTSTYAADGLRHRMVTGANTTDYVLDGTMAVQDVVNGAVAATYLAGPRGPEYRRDDETGAVRWYVYDGLGSVVGEVAPDGSLTCTRKLDAYGCVRSSSGTATSKHKFVGSLGHPSDDETGLIYMRARHYDPVCGRFISEDPARNGANWFAYCDNNPANSFDPDGRESLYDVIYSLVGTAWSIYQGANALGGADTITWAISRLRDIIISLRHVINVDNITGEAQIIAGEETAGGLPPDADEAMLEQEVARIQVACGAMTLAETVVARAAIRSVEVMINLLDE